MLNLLRRIRNRFRLRSRAPITRAVVDDRLTYLHVEKLRRIEDAIRQTQTVKGDIAEFGIALGGSAIILAHHLGANRRFHGFDVFGMIPPPTSDKDDAKSKNRYEVIKSENPAVSPVTSITDTRPICSAR